MLKRLLFSILLISNFAHATEAKKSNCEDHFESAPTQEIRTQSEKKDIKSWVTQFENLADAMEKHRTELIEILSQVDNKHGAEYEITQAIKTLRGVRYHEQEYLENIQGVQNIAVYGSTNIPLYSLILHAIIPSSTSANIWYRTPVVSRDTYLELFQYIQKIAPSMDLSRVHILTSQRDTQYENFRKLHVLGLNRKGKRQLRPASEVIIFTGKTETGEKILADIISKLERLKLEQDQSILFMRFGSGLNPVIVTQTAGDEVGLAVDAAIESIRINCAQDCIAPKFYAIHKYHKSEFNRLLMGALEDLSYSPVLTSDADYGPLTFNKDLKPLIEFRDQHSAYLKNPKAKINPDTKQVDPHFFTFPIEMFGKVELVDHFAPFIITFEYSSEQEIEMMANDPRVKDRAMYASIFGDSSSTKMFFFRKLFEDTFHTTVINQSVFVEESGNFPFGGYGGNASRSSFVRVQNGQVSLNEFDRPLIFSNEASRFYGNQRISADYGNLRTSPKLPGAQKNLRQLIELSGDPETGKMLGGQWLRFNNPVFEVQENPFQAFRREIRRTGLSIPVELSRPYTEEEIQSDQMLFGENIVYQDDRKSQQELGATLHPTSIDRDTKVYNNFHGTLNPHYGYGYLHPLLFTSKTNEYWAANAIWPGSMPTSLSYSMLKDQVQFSELERRRLRIIEKIKEYLNATSVSSEQEHELFTELLAHLDSFFNMVNSVFPRGAFIKNFDESTTGDLGNQITTYSQNSANYVRQFMNRLAEAKYRNRSDFESPSFQRILLSHFYQTGTKMVNKLLLDPDDLLIQERVRIKQTDLGFPMEIRVDFVYGTAIHSRARYTHEYLGPQMATAERILNEFFAAAPAEMRMLSGGADLVQLETGEWVFMELNFGSNSGSISANVFPIDANLFVSKLQEKETNLIKWLRRAYRAGIPKQKALLLGLDTEKEKWNKKSIRDLSIAEVARYFRDLHLEDWLKNPTTQSAEITLQKLETLFEGVGSSLNRDLPLLIKGAVNFMNAELLRLEKEGLDLEAPEDAA